MTRDIFAYVSDILEACDSIGSILRGISVEAYSQTREKRQAVERKFILIGEAVAMLVQGHWLQEHPHPQLCISRRRNSL